MKLTVAGKRRWGWRGSTQALPRGLIEPYYVLLKGSRANRRKQIRPRAEKTHNQEWQQGRLEEVSWRSSDHLGKTLWVSTLEERKCMVEDGGRASWSRTGGDPMKGRLGTDDHGDVRWRVTRWKEWWTFKNTRHGEKRPLKGDWHSREWFPWPQSSLGNLRRVGKVLNQASRMTISVFQDALSRNAKKHHCYHSIRKPTSMSSP